MKRLILIFVSCSTIFGAISAQETVKDLDLQINRIGNQIKANEQSAKILKQQTDSLFKLQAELIRKKDNLTYTLADGDLYIADRSTYIYDSPKRSKTLTSVPQGAQVKFKGEEGDCYRVEYNGTEGWVSKFFFKSAEKIKREEEAKAKAELELKNEEERFRNDRKALMIKRYGELNGMRVLNHDFWIGMNSEMLKDSWGKPTDINRTVGSFGVHEQWVYENDHYFYFEDGILTSYQN